jgi:hypothetical protein
LEINDLRGLADPARALAKARLPFCALHSPLSLSIIPYFKEQCIGALHNP